MRKKILFFINTLCAGGAERVLVDIANNIDKSKYEITVKTLLDHGEFVETLEKNVNYESIIRVKNAFLKKVFTYMLSFVVPAKITHRLFIGNGYDYECAFLEGVPTKIISASGNKKSQKYGWIHTDICKNLEFNKIFRSNDKQIECYKKFDRILCVSEGVKEAFEKLCGRFANASVLYNVIDDEKIRASKKEETEACVVAVGRLEPQKGYDRLLRIHKRLTDEGFCYKLIFVGDGTESVKLQNYVKTNGLEKNTEFLGFCKNPYEYMSGAGFLVFPSLVEGFCTAICEAVILGKPVLATDCCGTREILGNSEFGLVCENNEDAIYDGMKQMLTDGALRKGYSQKALLRGKEFSLNTRLEALEKLFD